MMKRKQREKIKDGCLDCVTFELNWKNLGTFGHAGAGELGVNAAFGRAGGKIQRDLRIWQGQGMWKVRKNLPPTTAYQVLCQKQCTLP